MDTNKTIIGLLTLFVGLLAVSFTPKKKITIREPYQDLFYAKDLAKDNWVSRPNFRADLSPRFDSERMSGGQIVGQFPGMSVQGAPLTPVANIIPTNTAPNFASMGAAYDSRLPAGGLTNSQVNKVLQEKFGRSSSNYTEARDLLPVADMKKTLAKDPSDPGTFMYDRYLFAPLKRRYGNVNVDHIRGDIPIAQIRQGWFDTPAVAKQDLTQGYFADYLDIQQSTNIKDSLFERAPTDVEQVNPWGKIARETVWSSL